MRRMDFINSRLSALPNSGKRIVYLVTENREILSEIFFHTMTTLKALCPYAYLKNYWIKENFYKSSITNSRLVDLYDALEISDYYFDIHNPKIDMTKGAYFYLTDFHMLEQSIAENILKQFIAYAQIREEHEKPVFLFLISPILQIPLGFQNEIEIIDVPEMDKDDITDLLISEAEKEIGRNVSLFPAERQNCEEAAFDFKGVSEKGILQILHSLQEEYGSFFGRQHYHNTETVNKIQRKRKELVAEYKKETAKHDSTITLLEPKDSVSGMTEYFEWLKDIKEDFINPEAAYAWGLEVPKGVLLTGVPGSGKTQTAKKTAYELGNEISLVQFRMDNLLGGIVGKSEENFKRCRKQVEALAPCVVLIDEIEKIFGKENQDSSGVKMNLLAALLDWLQENKKQIFFFATSNSVSGLPPELLRDGRFDMRFCAFMPTKEELKNIIIFHLEEANKRSGGRFSAVCKQCEELADEFLRKIAAYAKEHNKDLFYTGSNIEALILKTNRQIRKNKIDNPDKDTYLEYLLEMAKSNRSQPYGETNMHSIVEFWMLAKENKYTSTGGEEILPFAAFDTIEGKFKELPTCKNPYDIYMQQRLKEEIEKKEAKRLEEEKMNQKLMKKLEESGEKNGEQNKRG